jgi:hypothetical protein
MIFIPDLFQVGDFFDDNGRGDGEKQIGISEPIGPPHFSNSVNLII